ncbi:hypothetical protein GGR54DRAFT_592396 [Hypoxylon sp. NC1633]|nr:hypothetical protein GGR54DRAFT_592396 [Hypoxylon sp. NC1633]
MISFGSSCLRGKHDALFRRWALPRLANVPSRASSLSAIHRGLRSSQKARPQGFKKDSLNTAGSGRTPRRAPAATRPSFKIMKGKKDITDKGPKPKSRQARFYDPNEEFGKKSLVYQMRTGPLREKLAGLSKTNQPAPRSRENRSAFDQFEKHFDQGSKPRHSRFGDRHSRKPALATGFERRKKDFRPYNSSMPSTDWNSSDKGRAAGNQETSWKDRKEEQSSPPAREQRADEGEKQAASHTPRSRDTGPIRVPRTTAASQFLYGHSVVKAALRHSQRKLYKLYLYCGEHRRQVSLDESLERRATQVGVPIIKVTNNEGLRMMDKMSESRPHNSIVLEASAIPQLPLKALGPAVEEPSPGFDLELAHQSIEEAEVNGTSDFFECPLPPGRKPFVLLLDSIQDPGNLGAIVRSAMFLGVNAIVTTKRNSASMTSVAVKASSGASEVMKMFSIDSTLDFINRSKELGWVVYAAVAPASRPRGSKHITLDRVDSYDPLSTDPTILVIGSEGEGLTKPTRRLADFEVSIPNNARSGVVDSLNVSAATAILCSAFLKKQFSSSKFDKILEEKDDDEDDKESRLF